MRRHLPRDTSFVRFLCDTFWKAWRHLTVRSEKYAHIYARDCYTLLEPRVLAGATSPPHHVRFRSRGGIDDDDNVIGPVHPGATSRACTAGAS